MAIAWFVSEIIQTQTCYLLKKTFLLQDMCIQLFSIINVQLTVYLYE